MERDDEILAYSTFYPKGNSFKESLSIGRVLPTAITSRVFQGAMVCQRSSHAVGSER
jgi:hypothetical protein